jgi:hypothetical protein
MFELYSFYIMIIVMQWLERLEPTPSVAPGQALATSKNRLLAHITPDGGENWGVYNSPLVKYQKTFDPVLQGQPIAELVSQKSNPLVIDLMSSTTALADLFYRLPDVPGKRGIALSLADMREDWEKKRDDELGLVQLAGDLTKSSTWRALKDETEGIGADLILERSVLGVNVLPIHSIYYAYAIAKVWGLMSPDHSVALIDLPGTFELKKAGVDILEWTENLRQSGIDTAVDNNQRTLLLHRDPSSPAILPT